VEGFVSSGCFQQKQQDRLPGLDVAWEDEHMAVVVKPQGGGWVGYMPGGRVEGIITKAGYNINCSSCRRAFVG
jgi:23S rRNA-/tRNA-specific pseudouridylate synthase